MWTIIVHIFSILSKYGTSFIIHINVYALQCNLFNIFKDCRDHINHILSLIGEINVRKNPPKRAVKNGESRDTGNIGHKTHNEDNKENTTQEMTK